MNGTDLLAEFRKNRGEAAFSALVRRYTNLVFSVARRRVNNVSLAEEATQTVFIKLAAAVPRVRNDAELAAWLHRTTIHASIDLWRAEARRHQREERAANMQTDAAENAQWEELAPVIDEALNELSDADRQAILLRFFERRSMRDLGVALGVSEDAAKMRVSRALEHLRAACGKRGVACAAGVLAALLMDRSVEAASAALIVTLAGLQIPAATSTGGAVAFTTAIRTVLSLAAGVVGVAVLAFVASHIGGVRNQPEKDRPSDAAFSTNPRVPFIVAPATTNPEDLAPNPVKLLREVARARNRVRSGEIELDWVFSNENATNQMRFKVLFDGIRRRFESLQHEYSYSPEANDNTNVQAQAERMGQARAVQAGLLTPYDVRRIQIFDGAALLVSDDGPEFARRAYISDPNNEAQIPDPRCLGISAPFTLATVEYGLCLTNAAAVRLIGEELVDDTPCWHVRIDLNAMPSDFWLEKAHPTRVLKHTLGGDTIVAKYDDAHPEDPLPIEVTESVPRVRAGVASTMATRITRRSARINIPVDPACWTLAGLDLKIGDDITDNRLMRRIGYWDGAGLSDLPPARSATAQPAVNGAELRALMESQPYSPEALDAAQWFIANTPDGPEVEEAADVIIENHVDATNLVPLCAKLERLRPRSARRILQALLDRNPSIDVRGNACFALASLRQTEAKYGADHPATVEAQSLYQRVVTDFAKVKSNDGTPIEDLAQPELADLGQLCIGQPAPQTEGLDLNGQPLSLSSYRGQIVILDFWSACCPPTAQSARKWLDPFAGKPVAVIGVFGDPDALQGKAIAEEAGVTWPSFGDGRSGPIWRAWNNKCWPAFQVIDGNGIIRYRNLTEVEVPGAIAALLGN